MKVEVPCGSSPLLPVHMYLCFQDGLEFHDPARWFCLPASQITGWTTGNYYAIIRTSYYNGEGTGKMGKKLLDFWSQNENTGAMIYLSKKILDKYICYNYIMQHL